MDPTLERLSDDVLARREQLPRKPAPVVLTGERVELRPLDLAGDLDSPIAQGTGVSREATHLMCAHAFALGYRRVEWKCDANNLRSRRAALSYGFTFEGIQEAHYIVKGRNRDTAWFRILDREWPALQTRSRTM
ncbi:MAG: GNAT family N-acetyltransferase [Deltaproteobacteria bacterium]|nr:GNAT family N-acetyltransferase [Deltaproteobacteria bacterium]MDQ3298033.1 GNAT family N-acetyltransferase [Myxococcota bacterium]